MYECLLKNIWYILCLIDIQASHQHFPIFSTKQNHLQCTHFYKVRSLASELHPHAGRTLDTSVVWVSFKAIRTGADWPVKLGCTKCPISTHCKCASVMALQLFWIAEVRILAILMDQTLVREELLGVNLDDVRPTGGSRPPWCQLSRTMPCLQTTPSVIQGTWLCSPLCDALPDYFSTNPLANDSFVNRLRRKGNWSWSSRGTQ